MLSPFTVFRNDRYETLLRLVNRDDIAFAASTLLDSSGDVWLYYSIADRKPYRCRLRVEGASADAARR